MSKGQRGITRSTKENEKCNEVELEINLEFRNQNVLVSSLWGKCPKDKGGSHVARKKTKSKK
jgi:histidinol phosphatase-like enzyme